MASGTQSDPATGAPYTGTPVQQAPRDGRVSTVLDMNRLVTTTITQHGNDDHYVADGPHAGDLYHE